MPDRGTRNWNWREAGQHRTPPKLPRFVRIITTKVWPGKRNRKGKVTK